MLKINNLHANVEGHEILKGVNLEINPGEIHAIMGPNGSGKSTLASVITGNEDYEVTEGEIYFEEEDISELEAHERAHKGIFLSFQYPVEIPGVSVTNFMRTAINQTRIAQGGDKISGKELLQLLRKNAKLLDIDKKFLKRYINDGFSGGEKKRNEIFQMAMMDPKLGILDETDSGLDIDALKTVADGVNKLQRDDNATMIITHYQRILQYIIPDYVHVLLDGKVVKSGGKELAHKLEEHGYDWLRQEKETV